MLELKGQESNFISDVRKGILPAGGSSGALRSPSLWSLPFGLPGFLQRSSSASPPRGKGAWTVGLQLPLSAPQAPSHYGPDAVGEREVRERGSSQNCGHL